MKRRKGGSPPNRLLTAIKSAGSDGCPSCGVSGVVRGSGDSAWMECPCCGRKIGSVIVRRE